MDALPDLSSLDTTRLARSLRPAADEVGFGWGNPFSFVGGDAPQRVADAIVGCASEVIKKTLKQVLGKIDNRFDWFWDRISVGIAVKLILCASALTPYNAREIDNIVNVVLFKLFKGVNVVSSQTGTLSDWQRYVEQLDTYEGGTDINTLVTNGRQVELAVRPFLQLMDTCLLIVVVKLKKSLIQSPCIEYARRLVKYDPPFLFQSDWIEKLVENYGDTQLPNFPVDSSQFRKVYDVAKAMEEEFKSMYEVDIQQFGQGSFGSVYPTKRKGSPGEYDLVTKNVFLAHGNISALQAREIFMWGLVRSDEKHVSQLENIGFDFNSENTNLSFVSFVSKLAVPFDRLFTEFHRVAIGGKGRATPEYLDFAKRSLRHLVSGVKALHDMNILHLDLKPANMVLNPNTFNVQIIDFGGAFKYSKDVFTKTTPGDWRYRMRVLHYVISPGYTAPELLCAFLQSNGLKSFAVSKACDVWSIGVIAAQLFHPVLDIPYLGYQGKEEPGFIPRGIFYLTSNFPDRQSSMYTTFQKGFDKMFDINEEYTSDGGKRLTSGLQNMYSNYLSRENRETFNHLMQFWQKGCFPIEPKNRKDASQLLRTTLLSTTNDEPFQENGGVMQTAIQINPITSRVGPSV